MIPLVYVIVADLSVMVSLYCPLIYVCDLESSSLASSAAYMSVANSTTTLTNKLFMRQWLLPMEDWGCRYIHC